MAVHGRQSANESASRYLSTTGLLLSLIGTQLEEESRKQLMEEFGAKTLPPNHALTLHVHRIVSRILEANHLGTLKTSKPKSSTWFDDSFQGHIEDPVAAPGARQWELMVVKDDHSVNAMASFGTSPLSISSWKSYLTYL